MKKTVISIILFLFPILAFATNLADSLFSISGHVFDYKDKSISACSVCLLNDDFKIAYSALTDDNGYYIIENVPKGEYRGLYAICMDDYPMSQKVSEDDMRLEFWAWNILLDEDLVINPRYHRLELYGTKVVEMGMGYMIYTRPMSLSGFLASKGFDGLSGISPLLNEIDFQVYANGELLKVNSIQLVDEFVRVNQKPLKGFIIQVDKFVDSEMSPYIEFRLVAFGKKYEEYGENLYFYRKKNYVKAGYK